MGRMKLTAHNGTGAKKRVVHKACVRGRACHTACFRNRRPKTRRRTPAPRQILWLLQCCEPTAKCSVIFLIREATPFEY